MFRLRTSQLDLEGRKMTETVCVWCDKDNPEGKIVGPICPNCAAELDDGT